MAALSHLALRAREFTGVTQGMSEGHLQEHENDMTGVTHLTKKPGHSVGNDSWMLPLRALGRSYRHAYPRVPFPRD